MQFDSPGLMESVTDALARYALEPRRLHLEVTESLIMRDPASSAQIIARLKALGAHIVIEDFGTGYSSLAYLQRFTFDALKIDRAFVSGIGDAALNGRSEYIVAAVVMLRAHWGLPRLPKASKMPRSTPSSARAVATPCKGSCGRVRCRRRS